MKIVLTGSGTGGHFYPLIAVAEEINKAAKERKLLDPKLYFIGPTPYDARALYENSIEFRKSSAGRMRRYFSLKNFFDIFKTGWGTLKSLWLLYTIYPDVIFSKGGFASFPTVLAAKLFRIPLLIHESDAHPGRVNKWSGTFARKVAIAFPETAQYFDEEKVAHTGHPVRRELYTVAKQGGHQFLKLDPNTPTILILGGSSGSTRINNVVLDALPKLVEKYQVIHQVGKENLPEVEGTAKLILGKSGHKGRYRVFDFLNPLALRMAAGASSIIISRAGAGLIFEIATWGLPSIIIPIPEEISHDQRLNAFSYARESGAVVIEQKNLTPNVLVSEINRIIDSPELREKMSAGAKSFATPEAARTIADALIDIGLEHEVE